MGRRGRISSDKRVAPLPGSGAEFVDHDREQRVSGGVGEAGIKRQVGPPPDRASVAPSIDLASPGRPGTTSLSPVASRDAEGCGSPETVPGLAQDTHSWHRFWRESVQLAKRDAMELILGVLGRTGVSAGEILGYMCQKSDGGTMKRSVKDSSFLVDPTT